MSSWPTNIFRWKYVTEHNVQLPDEYDRIFEDLEPFWGMAPSDLIAIHEESELKKDSYTVGKNESVLEVDVLTYAFENGRYDQLIVGSREIIKMFRVIQDDLPPFRMTISPHDGPNRHTDYKVKQAVLEAAAGETCKQTSLSYAIPLHFKKKKNNIRHRARRTSKSRCFRLDQSLLSQIPCPAQDHQPRQSSS